MSGETNTVKAAATEATTPTPLIPRTGMILRERQDKVDREWITCDGPGCNETNPTKRCSACKVAYYCSKECQVKHWRAAHRGECNEKTREIELFYERYEKIPHSQCAITLEEPPTNPIILPNCGHVFSLGPLCDWVEENYNTQWERAVATNAADSSDHQTSSHDVTCPTCRKPIGCHTIVLVREHIQRLAWLANRPTDVATEHKERYLEQALAYWSVHTCIVPNDDLWGKVCRATTFAQFGQPQKAIKILADVEKQYPTQIENHSLYKAFMTRAKARAYFQVAVMLQDKMKLPGEAKPFFGHAKYCYAEIIHESLKMTGGQQPIVTECEGFPRCCYEVGEYDAVKTMRTFYLDKDRTYPGFRKFLALSYKAEGDLDAALKIAAEAALYEAPWDDVNMAENLDLYESLLAERG